MEKRGDDKKRKGRWITESYVVGVIAISFLILGYQTALFIHRAAVTKIVANRDEPDTVFIYMDPSATIGANITTSSGGESKNLKDSGAEIGSPVAQERRNAKHSPRAEIIRNTAPPRKVENFSFDPNTATEEEFCRLGFSPKQAQSILNYRNKGGKFRRKSDFAKSFVVSDEIYSRLEPYIDIPLVDLNLADSAAFDSLPGIGGWFASKMVDYRRRLGGYSCKEQLMEIYRFNQEKFDALSDLIVVSSAHLTPYRLWQLPADSLRMHPYVGSFQTAKAIVFYRENNPSEKWTIEGLRDAGILSPDQYSKLSRCAIAR